MRIADAKATNRETSIVMNDAEIATVTAMLLYANDEASENKPAGAFDVWNELDDIRLELDIDELPSIS